MIDWKNITSTEFEEVCYQLMECNNFTNLKWYGKGGGDKGRDIICEELVHPLANITIVNKWLVQCKRYTEKNITKAELSESFSSAREHGVDCYLLAITSILTSDLKDWVESVRNDYKFKILLWEDLDIKREIYRNLTLISSRFPSLIRMGSAIEFEEMQIGGKAYMCNEIEEVGFYIINDYGYEKNIKFIQEFIQFIKSNEIKFC